jgi:hypothetical protein
MACFTVEKNDFVFSPATAHYLKHCLIEGAQSKFKIAIPVQQTRLHECVRYSPPKVQRLIRQRAQNKVFCFAKSHSFAVCDKWQLDNPTTAFVIVI